MFSLPTQIAGPLLGVVAALAIRRGASTEDGSSFDAPLAVLLVTVAILTPLVIVVDYLECDLTI